MSVPAPYLHLPGALSSEDIDFLKRACKTKLSADGIPCYTLIDRLTAPSYLKIKALLEQHVGSELFYLNDFYIYTDRSAVAKWHVDTELFTFEDAINAWILLWPDRVDNPLAFVDGINEADDRAYHSVSVQDGECTFFECITGESEVRSIADVEANKIRTPPIDVGDILIINPKRFHKTNVEAPKHSCAIKFVLKGADGFLAKRQVPAHFWPEVAMFNRILAESPDWDHVVDGIRRALQTREGRDALSAGFFPEKFELYKTVVNAL